jgi:hypothetical protein
LADSLYRDGHLANEPVSKKDTYGILVPKIPKIPKSLWIKAQRAFDLLAVLHGYSARAQQIGREIQLQT